jgi:hypothetical protein
MDEHSKLGVVPPFHAAFAIGLHLRAFIGGIILGILREKLRFSGCGECRTGAQYL